MSQKLIDVGARAIDDNYDVNRGGEITNIPAVSIAYLQAIHDAGYRIVPKAMIQAGEE